MRIEVIPNTIHHDVSCMLCIETFTMGNRQAFILLDEDAPAPVCDQCAKSSLPDLLARIRSRAADLRGYAEFLETIAAELNEMPDPAAFAATDDTDPPA
jgi:hypothetical protein